jgi:hypothetical protein
VYGLPMTLAPDARALDTSPAWYCHVGAAVALPWLAGLDRTEVQQAVLASGRAAGEVALGLPPERVGLVASVAVCCNTYAEVLA